MNVKRIKNSYRAFKIEFHRRYGGTYMLFGARYVLVPNNEGGAEAFTDWSLLGETIFPNEADDWAKSFGCSVPEMLRLKNPDDPQSLMTAVYEDCHCCRDSNFCG